MSTKMMKNRYINLTSRNINDCAGSSTILKIKTL